MVIGNTWLQWRLVMVMMIGEVTIIWVTGVSITRTSDPILNTRDSWLLTRDTGAANMGGEGILRGLGISLVMVVGVCLI